MPTVNDPNGNPQAVQANGYALNYCSTMDMSAHAGDSGNAYSWVLDVDTNAATSDFAYIKNSSDMELRIYKIRAFCTADIEIEVKTGVTGTATSPSTGTPVNALVGSGNAAEGTFQYRAGDMAFTGGDIFDRFRVDASINTLTVVDYPGELALSKNQTMLLHVIADPTAAMEITIFFYYHAKIERS